MPKNKILFQLVDLQINKIYFELYKRFVPIEIFLKGNKGISALPSFGDGEKRA